MVNVRECVDEGSDVGKVQESQLKAGETLASRAVTTSSSRVREDARSRRSEGTTADSLGPLQDTTHYASENPALKTKDDSGTKTLGSPRDPNSPSGSSSRSGLQDHKPQDTPSRTRNWSSTPSTSDSKTEGEGSTKREALAKGEGSTKGDGTRTLEEQASSQPVATKFKPSLSGKPDGVDNSHSKTLDKPVLKTKDRISESSRYVEMCSLSCELGSWVY